MFCFDSVSDDQLVEGLRTRLADHRRMEAEVIAYLAEVDRRRLYLERAMPSMHAFCVRILHMSDGQAYLRIAVARASRHYPVLLSILTEGRIHLSGIARLVPHLTRGNIEEVLGRAVHKSKREIEALVAELFPKPDLPATIRRLPQPRALSEVLRPGVVVSTPSDGEHGESPASLRKSTTGGRGSEQSAASAGLAARTSVVGSRISVVGSRSSGAGHRQSAVLQPIAPARYKVQFTASEELQGKLRRAQALLRHKEHGGDLAEVVDEAMTLLLAKLEARRQGKARKPRKTVETSDTTGSSRHIPTAIRREVHERDEGRCAFVDGEGNRCPCDDPGLVQLHHVVPYGQGGNHGVENLELRCRAHNRYQAELDYGQAVMDRYRRGVGKARDVSGASPGRDSCAAVTCRGAAGSLSIPSWTEPSGGLSPRGLSSAY